MPALVGLLAFFVALSLAGTLVILVGGKKCETCGEKFFFFFKKKPGSHLPPEVVSRPLPPLPRVRAGLRLGGREPQTGAQGGRTNK